MVLSSTIDYLEWINYKNPLLEISWLMNYIETARKISPHTPEMTIAREIAEKKSLGCGLRRKRNNDTLMKITEVNRRFHDLIVNNKSGNIKNPVIRNIEIHGIITDITGFKIMDWCGKCNRKITAAICKYCGMKSGPRLQVFGQITDPTGNMPFYGEDRVAEILLSAHPAHIIRNIDIQRGFLFTFKHHLNNSENSKINSVNPWKLLKTLISSDNAAKLIGLPLHAAGNIELSNNRKEILKVFWFETRTYQEEIIAIEKRPEIREGSKNPLIAKRIECLKII